MNTIQLPISSAPGQQGSLVFRWYASPDDVLVTRRYRGEVLELPERLLAEIEAELTRHGERLEAADPGGQVESARPSTRRNRREGRRA